MRISIVVPAYNEEKRLRDTIEKSVAFLNEYYPKVYELIIVDDGSTDDTLTIARELKNRLLSITVITYGENKGKGYAVKKGMLTAEGEYCFFMDADGSTPIEEIQKLLPFLEVDADIVIGSRHLTGSAIQIKQPYYRRMLGRAANWLIRKMILPGMTDSQCGFKGFKKKAVTTLFPLQRICGWGFDFEILALARAKNFSIVEVPVQWLDSHGSRVRPIRGAVRTLGELLKVKYRLLFKKY